MKESKFTGMTVQGTVAEDKELTKNCAAVSSLRLASTATCWQSHKVTQQAWHWGGRPVLLAKPSEVTFCSCFCLFHDGQGLLSYPAMVTQLLGKTVMVP